MNRFFWYNVNVSLFIFLYACIYPLFGRLHTAWLQKVFKALFLFARRRFSPPRWPIMMLKGLFSLKHLFHLHFFLQLDSKRRCLMIFVGFEAYWRNKVCVFCFWYFRYQELMKESSRMPLFDLRKLNASLPVPSAPNSSIKVLVLGANNDFIVVRSISYKRWNNSHKCYSNISLKNQYSTTFYKVNAVHTRG